MLFTQDICIGLVPLKNNIIKLMICGNMIAEFVKWNDCVITVIR